MKLGEVVSFRKDLLFDGAVQLGWFERKKALCDKAASHFIFHGPDYHGVSLHEDTSLRLLDTASFTKEIAERLVKGNTDMPFTIAIAGYGTGKSHLALTLATLFSKPRSEVSARILQNLSLADPKIGRTVKDLVLSVSQPFLVVALNGMEDFDLSSEIARQLLNTLKDNGIDTRVLANLRPRFRLARNFASSFHLSLKQDFEKYFGVGYEIESIMNALEAQDEQVFQKVDEIYTQKMGTSFPAVGRESLQDLVRVVTQSYCGPGKPFAGLLILFDEFGRYIEFAVQKPHIAGPAALQQLFEAVQENAERALLVAFVQSELKAYASRVMPERRDEIDRYLTRFDGVRKVRLSTNLETVIASLLEKKNHKVISEQIGSFNENLKYLHSLMADWFPDLRDHSLWCNGETFHKVIAEGCWPLHPLSTWVLYRLSAVGKSLQQRSAISLLAEVIDDFGNKELLPGQTIRPTDLLTEGLLSEFTSSEDFGAQRAVTEAYHTVLEKYQHVLSSTEKKLLKGILIEQKVGIKVKSKNEYVQAMSFFCGLDEEGTEAALTSLEKEYGVLEWNGLLCQYEIVGDAVPRKSFLAAISAKVSRIDSKTRAEIFATGGKAWLGREEYNTDFGEKNSIFTREWNYNVYFTNTYLLKNQIQFALQAWYDATNVDDKKGQLIYCYVGPESDLKLLEKQALDMVETQMQAIGFDWTKGAPLAVLLLYDAQGTFGQNLAEYRVLESELSEEEKKKFANFIPDRRDNIKQELEQQFLEMEKQGKLIFATDKVIKSGPLKQVLEQLFDVVYPDRIPFPFDGFNTIRGNAARDTESFTKELLLGRMDREWLQARNQQQRNRGYKVLDESWNIFDRDGSVRVLPGNAKIRKVLNVLDERLQSEEDVQPEPVNLGKIVRKWLAPPFGLNLAAAGLLLAIYLGRRKDEIELTLKNSVISKEEWLEKAMPTSFFDLSVLDNTEVVRMSKHRISEWERLLEEWESEATYLGKIECERRAQQLQKTVSLPGHLKYKYEFLENQTKEAKKAELTLDSVLTNALERIRDGSLQNDVGLLSWGAAMLAEQRNTMVSNKERWTEAELEEVSKHYMTARTRVKEIFPMWLNEQKVANIEHLSKFKHYMLERIGGNLEQIDLDQELDLLKAHVEDVEKNVRLIAKIQTSIGAANQLIKSCKVSPLSTLAELQEWVEKAKEIQADLNEARKQTSISKYEIDKADAEIEKFIQSCIDQMQQHRSRAAMIYDHRRITCIADIIGWETEVTNCIKIFAGQEQDLEDFRLALRQLEQLEKQYRRLDDDTLSEEELNRLLTQSRQELEDLFPDDNPPLDSDLIYEDIMKSIMEKRYQTASEWMERVLQKASEMKTSNDPYQVLSFKKELERAPAVLSEKQRKRVEIEIRSCERRMDELEVEGLLAKFNDLSDRNKVAFLQRLREYVQKHLSSAELRAFLGT